MNYLRNSWYCFNWSADLTTKPLGMRILDTYLVGYRDSTGNPVILDGRCPHRFAPLDRGTVKGDSIMCAYHGLEFSRDGVCIHNPQADGVIPPRARLRSYPSFERNRAVWVWMGDPELADQSAVPHQDFVEDPSHVCATHKFSIAANYELIIDNLLDLTHAPYLHASTLAVAPERSSPREHKFRMTGDMVHSDYHVASMAVASNKRNLFSAETGVFDIKMTWWPASCLRLDTNLAHHDGRHGLHFGSVHYLVPETERTTNYFVMFSRDTNIADEKETAFQRQMLEQAFHVEDAPMIEACQQLMNSTDLFALQPAILKTDVAAIQARRVLARLIAGERKLAGDSVQEQAEPA